MNHKTKFLEDLLALIEKYGAEFECSDHWQGYPECGRDLRITVDFSDYRIPEIDFGECIDIGKIKKLISTPQPEQSGHQ